MFIEDDLYAVFYMKVVSNGGLTPPAFVSIDKTTGF